MIGGVIDSHPFVLLSAQGRLYKGVDQWPLGNHQKQSQVGMIL